MEGVLMTEELIQGFKADYPLAVYLTGTVSCPDKPTFLPSEYREADISTAIVRELNRARDRIR